MIKRLIAASALLFAAPVSAQTQQEQLQSRYDRALAAGYKALFLCSAIANAERHGRTRSPDSVEEWELTGIQSPLDEIIGGLSYNIVRQEWPESRPHQIARHADISHVAVDWVAGEEPRIASYSWKSGCVLQPIGLSEPKARTFGSDYPPPRSINLVLSQSFNPAVQAIISDAFAERYGAESRTTVIMVNVDGKLRGWGAETGFDHQPPQRTWSVAKSIAATLIGAAVHRGEVDVNASAGLGDSDDDPRRAITIDHLLRMASGRYSDTPGNRTDPLYFGGSTVEETALHWPLIEQPGTSFRYANNDTLAAIKAIDHTFVKHPPAEFFAKVGMHHTVAETDWRGDYVLSSQVWSTARDLALLGQLYLNDGVWDGERILPEGWVEYVSAPSGPQPGRGCIGYGASWWLLNTCEGIPPDTIAAMGNRGQYVVVVPSRDVVIVRRGEDPAGGEGFNIVSFTRDVLAALEN